MISILQTTGIQLAGGNPANIALTFPNPTTSGSLIVLAFSNQNDYGMQSGTAPYSSISDTNNNTYNIAVEIDGGGTPGGDGDGGVEIDYITNAGAGISLITITTATVISHPIHTYTFNAGSASAVAWEVSGITNTSPDVTLSSNNTSATTGNSPGTFTLAQANEFVIIVGSCGANGSGITGADPPFNTNFQDVDADEWDGYSYIISSSIGPYTPNFDLDSGGIGAVAAVASFLGVSAPPLATSFALDDSLGVFFNRSKF